MIAERFEALARNHPEHPVAWTPAGIVRRGDLLAVAGRIERDLAAVPRGVRIAVRLCDGTSFLAALLAIWRRGGAAVLLDAAGRECGEHEAAATCGAAAVVDDRQGAPCVVPLAGEPVAADGAAVLKLTSGSTGRPRAVLASFAALVADAEALERTMAIGAADRVLAAVPLSFSYGLGSVAVPALWSGRAVVLPRARDPLGLTTAIRRGEPTVLPIVPAFARAVLGSRLALPASARLVVAAGARLDPATARAFRERFGLPIHVFYGASECGGIAYDRTGTAAEQGSVGTAVDGVSLRIDDDGRVRVRSPAVATAIEPDDGSLQGGEFTTPDLGELRDDTLVLLGRTGDVIDLGGYKVQPREIEAAVLQIDGVEDAAALPWTAPGGRAACAVLVAGRVDEALVRRHCVHALPAGKVPRCIVVVPRLPRNGRGKLERAVAERLLREAEGKADQVGA